MKPRFLLFLARAYRVYWWPARIFSVKLKIDNQCDGATVMMVRVNLFMKQVQGANYA